MNSLSSPRHSFFLVTFHKRGGGGEKLFWFFFKIFYTPYATYFKAHFAFTVQNLQVVQVVKSLLFTKLNQQNWKINYISGRSSDGKIWLSILQCKMGLAWSGYRKYSKIRNVCIIYLKYHVSQIKKHNMILATYKELLGTCIKSRKAALYIQYVPNQLVKILQCNCFAKFGSSACLFWYVQLLDLPTKMSKN